MSTNSAAATSSNSSRVKSLAITAICLVLVYVFTAVVNIRLPFAPNGGLVHLGNVPLFVAAILFGKRTGMIAGGPVRAVIEAAGIKDVRAKSMRSNNPINVVSATFAGLCGLVSAESVAEKRGKTVSEILG